MQETPQPQSRPVRRKLRLGCLTAFAVIALLIILVAVLPSSKPRPASGPGGSPAPAAAPASSSASAASSPTADPMTVAERAVCKLRSVGATNAQIITATGKAKPGMMSPRQVVRRAERDRCPQYKPSPKTVEFSVTGSSADVTYGASGSDHQGAVPMHITEKLGSPSYYAITAQLDGSGEVSCSIKVNGKTISRGDATGSYNIASCEIGQNPLTGRWEDDN